MSAEVAVTFTLLVGAALVLQSFQRLLALDPGFTKTEVCAFDVTFRGERYHRGSSRIASFRLIKEQLTQLPGVSCVAAVSHLPLGGSENLSYFLVEGTPPPQPGQEPLAEHRIVTTGYFPTMGVNLICGRDFEESDTQGKPLVAIVNETLARQFFPEGTRSGSGSA